MNGLVKFENDPWKITDVRVLTGLDHLPTHSGDDNIPEPLRGVGIHTSYIKIVFVLSVSELANESKGQLDQILLFFLSYFEYVSMFCSCWSW